MKFFQRIFKSKKKKDPADDLKVIDRWNEILAQLEPETWGTLPSFSRFLELHHQYNSKFLEEINKVITIVPQNKDYLIKDAQHRFVYNMSQQIGKMLSELRIAQKQDNYMVRQKIEKMFDKKTLFSVEEARRIVREQFSEEK